jgi:hypothetical protein
VTLAGEERGLVPAPQETGRVGTGDGVRRGSRISSVVIEQLRRHSPCLLPGVCCRQIAGKW